MGRGKNQGCGGCSVRRACEGNRGKKRKYKSKAPISE